MKRLCMCVEVMCLWKSLGFDKVKIFHILEHGIQASSLGNGVSQKAFMPGNHDPTGALGKMNLAGVFRVIGGWGTWKEPSPSPAPGCNVSLPIPTPCGWSSSQL